MHGRHVGTIECGRPHSDCRRWDAEKSIDQDQADRGHLAELQDRRAAAGQALGHTALQLGVAIRALLHLNNDRSSGWPLL